MSDALANICAVLTRPQDKNGALAQRLQNEGMRVIQAPALLITPVLDVLAPGHTPDCYDLVMFVSSNAVRCYLRAWRRLYTKATWPSSTLAAAVGGATACALQAMGDIPAHAILYPDDESSSQDSESLWALLEGRASSMKRALIVRGETGRDWLGERLEQAGVAVDRLAVYRRGPSVWHPDQSSALRECFEAGCTGIFLLTSSEGVEAVADNMRRLALWHEWERSHFVAIHQRIAARLQSVLAASGKVEPPRVKICQPGEESVFRAMLQTAVCTASS
ncbi:uroporphyrinogen-III synthase [Allopusillimonas ginsengisoli]|uniref:uroporphyrinogen-III synthase n=1 Tax=Allopusillimonas ginsengisoli TaxID=453575 RepID=UPI00101EE2E0|nr:uroporphyrinogen-III synthase [Allopusillimonas ginsengisoli]TEA77286.1 uroporphyrinogen-III synthase [Allopusillimonas ginsengisoli]